MVSWTIFRSKAFMGASLIGFPLDLTQDICKEKKLEVDVEEFEKEMEKEVAKYKTEAGKSLAGYNVERVKNPCGNSADRI